MAKPTPVDPAAVAENTNPDEDPGSATAQGLMTIYEIDTMGSGDPTDLFDDGVLKSHLSSDGETTERE
jgi:hypothetical protein